MPYEQVDLGPVPGEEMAASVGAEDYLERSTRECLVYKRMLSRLHPIPEGIDAKLAVKSFPHDFGTYREVVVKFDPNDEAATNYAYDLESNSPASWDTTARFELWWLERRDQLLREVHRGERDVATLPESTRLNQIPTVDNNANLTDLFAVHQI